MVDADAERQQVLQILGSDRSFLFDELDEYAFGFAVRLDEELLLVLSERHVSQNLGCSGSLFATMGEYQDLMPLDPLNDLLVAYLIGDHKLLDWFLLSDPDVHLLERHRSEASIEVEQAMVRVDSKQSGNIMVVREGRRQANDPDKLRCLLNLPDDP